MRYIIGVLVALGMLGAIFFFIFRGGGQEQQQSERIDLTRYANTDATVQVITDGPVVADAERRSYQISINRSSSTMQVFQGYNRALTAQSSTPNNQASYNEFIRSISRLNFTAVDGSAPSDERGYCPQGSRYIFRLVEGDRELLKGWTASCGSSQGNFKGDASTIRVLFREQVPDYYSLITGTGLN